MKIAIVGSGISGLGAAYFLQQKHEIVLFEKDARVGGHTQTIEVPVPGGTQPVDTGWIVFNPGNYPNLTALFAELDVPVRSTDMSFSVSIADGLYEWCGSGNPLTVFAQPSNLFRAAHWRMLRDILRLNARCRRRLRDGSLPQGSLAEFLSSSGLGQEVQRRYLLPMAALIWSCSPRQAAQYPAADFMHFFEAHGLFTTMNQPRWSTVVGGSHTYVRRLMTFFRGQLWTGTPVNAIERGPGAVRVSADGTVERFDAAICATHSDQALRLLPDATDTERRVLTGIPYTRSRCVLHTDVSFLPKRRAAWASWNYLYPDDSAHDDPVSGSYWMNQLQGMPGPVTYVVTLNPRRPVPREHVLFETEYEHPFYSAASVDTHRDLAAIQGRGGLYWAGAWTGYGFHEDGLRSALEVVARIDPACLPAWANLGRAHEAAPVPCSAADQVTAV